MLSQTSGAAIRMPHPSQFELDFGTPAAAISQRRMGGKPIRFKMFKIVQPAEQFDESACVALGGAPLTGLSIVRYGYVNLCRATK
jgi:hypothetical protein